MNCCESHSLPPIRFYWSVLSTVAQQGFNKQSQEFSQIITGVIQAERASNQYKVHTYRFQNGVDCYIKYKRKVLIYYTLVYWCWGKQCVLDIFTDPKAAMSPEDFSSRGWHCSPRDCKTQCYSIGSQTGGVQLCMYCIYCTRQNS